mmetsp:Transcript_30631/g.85800  ORF Transcript_30631/g.85800 Transcript_30631/m.85800 type:complete len:111 (+) Transcript_30631:21-353(+)
MSPAKRGGRVWVPRGGTMTMTMMVVLLMVAVVMVVVVMVTVMVVVINGSPRRELRRSAVERLEDEAAPLRRHRRVVGEALRSHLLQAQPLDAVPGHPPDEISLHNELNKP